MLRERKEKYTCIRYSHPPRRTNTKRAQKRDRRRNRHRRRPDIEFQSMIFSRLELSSRHPPLDLQYHSRGSRSAFHSLVNRENRISYRYVCLHGPFVVVVLEEENVD